MSDPRRANARALSLTIGLLFLGCKATEGEADRLFREEIQPLFQGNCNSECHVPGGFNGELFLGDEYGPEEFVNVPSQEAPLDIVEPGSPEESYLWHKLKGTHLDVGGDGYQMPYGNPPLSDEQIALIEEYILALD